MTKEQRPTIWQVPIYLPYLQPRLTEEAIDDLQTKIDGKLPVELIELLQLQNGGYLRFTGLNGLNERLNGIGPYFPNLLSVDLSVNEGLTIQLDGLVPLDGDGHWYLCLDYRQNRTHPRITYINTETDREENVAGTFAEDLDGLTLARDERYVVETTQSLDELVQVLQRILLTEWTGPDSWAHGYPVYRTKWNDNWIWMSPNEVPKGFVRKGEDRYEELKEAMNGTALRYPELSRTAIFLQLSDGAIGEKLRQLLTSQGIDLTPLSTFL